MISLAIAYSFRTSFGLLVEIFEQEFITTRAIASLGLTFNMVSYAIISPFAGYLCDIFSPRRIMLAGSLLATVGYFCLSNVTNLIQMLILYGFVFALASAWMGQVPCTALIRSFTSRPATTTGFASAGIGVGSLFITPLIGVLLVVHHWRTVTGLLAFPPLFLAAALLFSELAFSRPRSSSPTRTGESLSRTLPLVIRNGDFLSLFALFTTLCIAVYMVLVQEVPYASANQISGPVSSLAVSLVIGTTLVGSPIIGFLSDRTTKHNVALVCYLLGILGIICLLILPSVPPAVRPVFLFLGSILTGLAYASYLPTLPYITGIHLGNHLLGTKWGLITAGGGLGGGIGAWLGSMVFDLTGNYNYVWGVALLNILIATTLMFILSRKVHGGYQHECCKGKA